MTDISKALAIGGWMLESELLWLAEQAQKHQVIVEVGSYIGRSTRALADHCAGVVYAVDDWYGPRDVNLSDLERREAYTTFASNLMGTKARVYAVRKDHANLRQWFYKTPDMVFIDGDHEYDNVRRDIEFWMQWMAPGGLICGHDGNYPSVDRAVKEFFPDALMALDTTIWYREAPCANS